MLNNVSSTDYYFQTDLDTLYLAINNCLATRIYLLGAIDRPL